MYVIAAIPTEARGPKSKVGRAPCRACCLPQSIEPGQVHTPQELFCRALLGQRARGRLHHAGQVQAGRVVRGALAAAGTTAFPSFSLRTSGLSNVASPPGFLCGHPSP